MYEPLEKEFKEISDAKTKSEMIALIQKHKEHIVQSPNLKNFLKAAVYTQNKNLLQSFNETEIFESPAIDYYTRVDLLDKLANSYSYAYSADLKLSSAQSDALRMFKNSDIAVVKDEFERVKSSLKVLEKEHPELIDKLKPHYFPEDFPSEIIDLANINTNTEKSKIKAEVNKAAGEFKNNISLMTMLERANHIVAIKNTIDYDLNIYIDKNNEPRFTAENSAIQEFLSDFPDKSSRDYQYIKTATSSASTLFNFIRSVNDLQKFQKENNNVEPEKLPHDKREQLAKILNRVGHSYHDMIDNDKKLRMLIAQHPKQEIVSKITPPVIQEQKQSSNTPSQPQQLSTKPVLRLVEALLQDTFVKLEKAVKDNNKPVFNQLISEIRDSASPDQLQSTIKSLQHLKTRLKNSPENTPNSSFKERLSLLDVGIASLSNAKEKLLTSSNENQSAPSMPKRF